MRAPAMVGRKICAPTTPHGIPSSSMASDTMPVASPSARKPSTTPCGGRGTCIWRIFSRAMRPVRRFSDIRCSCSVEMDIGTPDDGGQPFGLVLQKSCEVLRRAAHHLGALFGDAGAHRLAAQGRGYFLVQQRDDGS